VFRLPLGVYRAPVWRDSSAAACAELAAIEVTKPAGIRRFPTFGRALCPRPVHSLAITAMLKSQRGTSDLSLLASSQLWATRLAPYRPLVGRLTRLPGVVDWTVAQLLHRLLQVGTAVAIGGDAIGDDERKANGLHGSTHQFCGITRA
jgi:hypothetical protein